MTYQEGINLCKRRRPEVDPIPAFVTQLKVYESRCREMGTIRLKEGSIRNIQEGDRDGRGTKRKAERVAIGPVRVARGPARRPAGISDSAGCIIGPSKNVPEEKYDGDCNFGNPEKRLITGPSPPKSPCKDDIRTNEVTRLAEHNEEGGKPAFCSQKKALLSPSSCNTKD